MGYLAAAVSARRRHLFGGVMSDIQYRESITDILQQLRKAKTAHLRWRAYAMALTSGYAVEEGQLPVEHTDCQFGGWYYGEGQALKDYPEFTGLEEIHHQVHAVYKDIFQMLFDKPEKSIWRKLMGKSASSDKIGQKVKMTIFSSINARFIQFFQLSSDFPLYVR